MGAFISLSLPDRTSQRTSSCWPPTLTIYDKLIADFTPGSPKYVFKGIAEFAHNPPVIVTGDNYESGARRARRAICSARRPSSTSSTSTRSTPRCAAARPRIKRLQEYVGESYFEYLAGLPDLVLLMDEAHRYRAKAGMRAITELKPMLGLELTATPQTSGRTVA